MRNGGDRKGVEEMIQRLGEKDEESGVGRKGWKGKREQGAPRSQHRRRKVRTRRD